MFSWALSKNPGAFIRARGTDGVIINQLTTATASTASSVWYDRWSIAAEGFSTSTGTALTGAQNAIPSAVTCVFAAYGSLQALESATVSANLQHATSSTGAGAADIGTATHTLTYGSTLSTAAQTVNGTLQFDVNLTTAYRFIRTQASVVVNTTQSTAGTTVSCIPVLVFGPGASLSHYSTI